MSEIWKKALLPAGSTIEQAIQSLDGSHLQLAPVVATDGKHLGTITDGDTRRGLLRGLDLKYKIDDIIHRHPFVVPPQMQRETVVHLMQVNKIRQLPIVDAKECVVGLHL